MWLLFSPPSTGFQLMPGQILKCYYLPIKSCMNQHNFYLTDLITPYCPSRPLQSSGAGLQSIPKVKKNSAGNRALSYRAPYLWNSLPPVMEEAKSIEKFQSKLKPTSLLSHLCVCVSVCWCVHPAPPNHNAVSVLVCCCDHDRTPGHPLTATSLLTSQHLITMYKMITFFFCITLNIPGRTDPSLFLPDN